MTSGTAKFGSLEDSTALLQSHVLAISEAIARTRQEIAEIREEQDAGRTRDELNAVVRGTEQATDTILTASETVDALAGGIARRAGDDKTWDDKTRDDKTRDDALAIQAQMQTIFEACNFQDLTGQRIAKVVRTIVLVEERVAEMMRLWSGSASPSKPAPERRHGEDGLLNGPALPGDAAVSQDAVDAMFP